MLATYARSSLFSQAECSIQGEVAALIPILINRSCELVLGEKHGVG